MAAAELPPFPTRVHVEVTSACNQRCASCPHPGMERTKRHLPYALFERVASEAGAARARLWLHFLGEPLLHPRIFDMVRCAKAAGAPEVGFSTNAVLLTPDRFEEVFASGLDRLEISIDAADRETYARLRGCDDWDRVHAHAAAFLAAKQARGVERPVVTLGYVNAGHDPAERHRFLETWQPRLGARDFLMTIPAIAFAGRVTLPRGAATPARAERTPCAWLARALLVLSSGDVVACASDFEAERVLGNVATQSLAEIWRSTSYDALRARHHAGDYAGLALCERCTDWREADGHGYRNFSAATPSPDGEEAA